jgi:hypothetical protein
LAIYYYGIDLRLQSIELTIIVGLSPKMQIRVAKIHRTFFMRGQKRREFRTSAARPE